MTLSTNPGYIINAKVFVEFWRRVEIGAADECWPWIGYIVEGRGKFKIRRRSDGRYLPTKAHRIAFLFANGYIPEGNRVIHHSCNNGICCNPLHLLDWTKKQHQRYHIGVYERVERR